MHVEIRLNNSTNLLTAGKHNKKTHSEMNEPAIGFLLFNCTLNATIHIKAAIIHTDKVRRFNGRAICSNRQTCAEAMHRCTIGNNRNRRCLGFVGSFVASKFGEFSFCVPTDSSKWKCLIWRWRFLSFFICFWKYPTYSVASTDNIRSQELTIFDSKHCLDKSTAYQSSIRKYSFSMPNTKLSRRKLGRNPLVYNQQFWCSIIREYFLYLLSFFLFFSFFRKLKK